MAARTATAEPGRAFRFGPYAVRNGSVGAGLLLDARTETGTGTFNAANWVVWDASDLCDNCL